MAARTYSPGALHLMSLGVTAPEIAQAMDLEARISKRGVAWQIAGRCRMSDHVFIALVRVVGPDDAEVVRTASNTVFEEARNGTA